VAKADLQIKVPDNVSLEDASTLGVGITTVGQGLYQSLGLPLPTEPAPTPFPILIYGGSTATGTLAIQFAKLSGLTVFTTSSPHNFDLVRRLGADHVFDYNSPTVGADIRAASKDSIAHVFDTISTESTVAISAEAIGTSGGKYSSLLSVDKFPRDDVTKASTIAYSGLGETFHKGGKEFPANKEHLEFQTKFWKLSGELLAQGKFKTHPVELREGGLDKILDGVDDLKQGKVSGVKLVYKM
jgi:NADPH:quinone reductase-like Zn-dependent oxidoreductase